MLSEEQRDLDSHDAAFQLTKKLAIDEAHGLIDIDMEHVTILREIGTGGFATGILLYI